MSQPVDRSDADRNLLFGILAVQMNFISRDALITAMHAWVLDKQKPLGQILHEQQSLTTEQLQALDALIVQHLKVHGDDPDSSLAAIGGAAIDCSALESFRDDDVQASLAKFVASPGTKDTMDGLPPLREQGRFKKGRFHKEGGLGEVYFAEDTELHREVALKEIKSKYADDLASRGRFVIEAEITGGLEHPGIVPVYGLGAYPNGRPYYAMRFIRGDSLKDAIEHFHAAENPGRAARERSLALRQLLRRFVDVCNAVAYAHNRGVLHRDLKPANIMLGPYGETLVVDWGLAKAGLEPKPHALDATIDPVLRPTSGSDQYATQAGIAVGTLTYMSPEQAAGRHAELGPASDIYSLGSTLYALLAGQSPYRGQDEVEVLAKVQRGDYPPLRSVKPETPPALAAICAKAMSLEPRRRYASALDLAADVEHWLADERVAAYAEPWTARAARWGRRHRTLVVSAAVFLVSAAVALAISTALVWAQQREAEKQRLIAVTNYGISRKQSFDIIRLIETSEPEFASVPALHDRRKELLTTAAGACRQFLEQEPDDLELQKRAAQIYRFTANFYRLTNETQAAERFYRDSIALREGLIAKFPKDEGYQLLLADSLRDHASLNLKLGQFHEATTLLKRSLEIVERLLQEDAERLAVRRRVALALVNLANVEYTQGLHEKSPRPKELIQRSEQLFRSLVDGPPQQRTAYDPLLLASALSVRAAMERDSEQVETALATHKEVIEIMRSMEEKKSKQVNESDVAYFLLQFKIEQSRTWAKTGKPSFLDAAEKNVGAAIAKLTELARDYRQLPGYEESLAAAICERGEIRCQAQKFAEARTDFDKSAELHQALIKKYPDLPEPYGQAGTCYASLARVAIALQDQDAAPLFQKAAAALQDAVRRSPGDARFARKLDEVQRAQSTAQGSSGSSM